jgi:hypothetical protein
MSVPSFGPIHIRGELHTELRKLINRANALPKNHPLRVRLGNVHGNASMQSVVNCAVEFFLESMENNTEAWSEKKQSDQ